MPTITLRQSSANRAEYIYMTGTGYESGETAVAYVHGMYAGAFDCDSNGEFEGQLRIPNLDVSVTATEVSVIGATSLEEDAAAFTVTS